MTGRRPITRALNALSNDRIVEETELTDGSVDPKLEIVIQRFRAASRREVRRLITQSPRLADLANVFPGALFALASAHGPLQSRLEAVDLIEAGAPLKRVAEVLGLPMWLRRLPPEAFEGSLTGLPTNDTFARRIANRLPRARTASGRWLSAVGFMAEAANQDAALWIAEQAIFDAPLKAQSQLNALAAYMWFSSAPSTAAYELIAVPFSPSLAFDTVLCAAKSWLNRIRLHVQLRPGVITDTWLAPGHAHGYSFVPLIDHLNVIQESKLMHNCADQFAEPLLRGRCRLFSIRRGQQRVATLEIGAHPRELGVLTITQLKGRRNLPASLEVWQAAHAWMATQQGLQRGLSASIAPEHFDPEPWRALMEPYRAARSRAPWMPTGADQADFILMSAGLNELARRGQVTSWLFN